MIAKHAKVIVDRCEEILFLFFLQVVDFNLSHIVQRNILFSFFRWGLFDDDKTNLLLDKIPEVLLPMLSAL